MIALAVLLPTIALAYLAAWRIAWEWPLRHRLGWGPWFTLWAGVTLSAAGFGVAILWLEILLVYLGHPPQWGLRVYAPAIESVVALDVVSLAVTTINHLVIRHMRGRSAFPWHPDEDDSINVVGNLLDSVGRSGGGGSSGGVGAVDVGGASWDWWPGFGLDLDLGEEGAILAVGVFVFLVAALLVTASLVGGAFVTYAVLRMHAKV